jgi:hypothetical protein
MTLHESTIRSPYSTCRHYYLCRYLPLTAGIDAVSRSLLQFKRGAHPDLHVWIDRALAALAKASPAPCENTVILRALHHDETNLRSAYPYPPVPDDPIPTSPLNRPASLDLLCHSVAARFHCRYLPALLVKSRPTIANKNLNLDERLAQLEDVYSAVKDGQIGPSASFLLVDDLMTTGATVRTIIQTLQDQYPLNRIDVFTLGKSVFPPNPMHHSPAPY